MSVFIEDNVINEMIVAEDFSEAAKLLFESQLQSWPQMTAGYKSLESVQIKSFNFGTYKIKVQFNPGRIISTSAKVDVKSIKERKCFLCSENLPAEQRGILYRGEYIILCNPFPIFPVHFTLTALEHQPQRIEDTFPFLLRFSKDLSKYYSVVYNGPKCGASAPDHLHFQAGTKGYMPLDDEIHLIKNEFGIALIDNEKITIGSVDDGLRKMITLESMDESELVKWFGKILEILNKQNPSDSESMINIISSYDDEFGWIVTIFLRAVHRPSHYFREDDSRIVISPASVDLAGFCVTPDEATFSKTDKKIVEEIFHEAFISKELFEKINQEIKKIRN